MPSQSAGLLHVLVDTAPDDPADGQCKGGSKPSTRVLGGKGSPAMRLPLGEPPGRSKEVQHQQQAWQQV